MKKLAIAFAGLAALGFSGAAFAEDATTGAWSTKSTPETATAPTGMSDSDMDKVTAGIGIPNGASAGHAVYGIGVAGRASTTQGFQGGDHPTGNAP